MRYEPKELSLRGYDRVLAGNPAIKTAHQIAIYRGVWNCDTTFRKRCHCEGRQARGNLPVLPTDHYQGKTGANP